MVVLEQGSAEWKVIFYTGKYNREKKKAHKNPCWVNVYNTDHTETMGSIDFSHYQTKIILTYYYRI